MVDPIAFAKGRFEALIGLGKDGLDEGLRRDRQPDALIDHGLEQPAWGKWLS